MNNYPIIAENPESTVVAEFEPGYRSAAQYQSEAEMERDFIDRLTRQAYEYADIKDEAALIANLRRQIERLNGIEFTDDEWQGFFKEHLGNPNHGIEEKTRTIQEDHRKVLRRADGTTVNVAVIDKENIHNNHLQVINQYAVGTHCTCVGNDNLPAHDNRYDVTILVNGLPLVHVELKRRGVAVKEAFNQIDRYGRDSFWAGTGLFEFVQIFIISNGTLTKYYSNTTRLQAVGMHRGASSCKSRKNTSNSYEFTSFWATRDNGPIRDLVDFTQTFLAKHTLLNIITKYCIFNTDRMLMVMRPYQIAATEEILQRIKVSTNAGTYGTIEGGGYIWHTTGSGKTLTSFKTARLASRMPEIEQVLFVVDRKDLDYQTMKEYDRFEKGAANSNTSTAVLARQLTKPEDNRIIITTIQKLSNFISRNRHHAVYDRHIVMIFDECHRSQFGDMHRAIVRKFKKYHMFGFTGTPIFPENAGSLTNVQFTTTEGAFGRRLHAYTIVDAIRDGNVLPFRVDYISTMHEQEEIAEQMVAAIDREKALQAPERIAKVSKYILDHFEQKTKRGTRHYDFRRLTNVAEVATDKRAGTHGPCVRENKQTVKLRGFNSIFAVASIPFAKLYYTELKKQMQMLPPDRRLKIATIYSYGANEEVEDTGGTKEFKEFNGLNDLNGLKVVNGIDDENNENTDGLDAPSREFLEQCIADYNAMFGTSYDTSAEKFQNYYKDLSLRMKNREIDLLIVVNMFLTGFDATTLNTLWVDKNLRMHGLLQAYSRTNRILNSIKSYGNIVCFRDLEPATNAALELFGDKDAGGLILLRTFDEYYQGYYDDSTGKDYPGYAPMIGQLLERYPLGTVIMGETAEKDFISLFGAILRARNILLSFDRFQGNEILTEEQLMEYKGLYLDLHDKYTGKVAGEKVNIVDDIVFEIELVKSVEINIDYILFLVAQKNGDAGHDSQITIKIKKAIASTPELRNKQDLIVDFVEGVTPGSDVEDEWHRFIARKISKEVNELISTENLRREATLAFLEQSFRDGEVRENGTAIATILPPMPLFGNRGKRAEKKRAVIEKVKNFFDRYYDICGGEFNPGSFSV